MADEIHVGDVGTQLVGTVTDDAVAVDVSLASVKTIVLTKPNGVVVTKTASFFTNGVDGKLLYTTIAGDLDRAGEWRIQGHVTLANGDWHTKISRFIVLRNLE